MKQCTVPLIRDHTNWNHLLVGQALSLVIWTGSQSVNCVKEPTERYFSTRL